MKPLLQNKEGAIRLKCFFLVVVDQNKAFPVQQKTPAICPECIFWQTSSEIISSFIDYWRTTDALSVNEKLHLQNAVFGRHRELLVYKNETELGLDLQKQIYLNVSFFKIYRHSIKAYLLVYEQKTWPSSKVKRWHKPTPSPKALQTDRFATVCATCYGPQFGRGMERWSRLKLFASSTPTCKTPVSACAWRCRKEVLQLKQTRRTGLFHTPPSTSQTGNLNCTIFEHRVTNYINCRMRLKTAIWNGRNVHRYYSKCQHWNANLLRRIRVRSLLFTVIWSYAIPLRRPDSFFCFVILD